MPLTAQHLAPIDLALVALYLVGITLFGLRFSARNKGAGKTLKSYFLADNTIPWWAIALSIVSAETSTLTIVSIPGVAFAGDMGFLQVVLGYMLGRVVVSALFLPKYFRGEMLTAYQLIDQRFGPALHKLTAGLFLLTRAAAEGVRVFAISIVVSIAIGTGDILSIGIISALTLLYTFEGGMAAVIWTDVVQMALYVVGTLIALFTLGAHVPGGWGHIHAVAAPLGKFHWLDFSLTLGKSYTFWAGILGGTFLTMASHGTDQLMVQRMLAARNLRESRLALLSSGAVIFLQFTLFLLIGVGLFVFYSTHPAVFKSNDHIFPTFIVQEMPHGVAGLLIAAILAAAMSNLSAALNSLSSTTVVDFYMHLRPLADVKERTFVSRGATIFWGFVLFGIAVYSVHAGGKGHVVETGLSIASVAYGCLLGVFLLGTLTKYATQTGAIIGMVVGFVTNLALWQLPAGNGVIHTGTRFGLEVAVPHVAFTWYVLIGSAVTFAVGSLFSLALPKRKLAAAAVLLCLSLSASAQSSVILSEQRESKDPDALRPAAAAQSLPPQNSPYDFTPISTLINEAIAAHKLPGAVVVIGHNGSFVFEQAYGNRKLAGEPGLDGKPSPAEPMTNETLFDMASLTKVLVTTTAILQLYEQHELDLEAPVAKYLPEFAQNNKGAITVRQLLTHYSGLPEDISLKDDWGLAEPDRAEGIRRAMAAVPYGAPGVTFKYSDINFITLGALVEKLSGDPLSWYAKSKVFAPLGMGQTGFHDFTAACGMYKQSGSALFIPSRAASPEELASCYSHSRPDLWVAGPGIGNAAPTAHDNEGTSATNPDFDHLLRGTVHDPTTRRMGGVAGHAGVFSTADDTAKFCQALLDKLLHNTGPFPLSQATLQMAISPQAPPTAVNTATIFRQDGTTTTGVAQRGLGWDLNSAFSRPRGTVFPVMQSFGHTGFTGTSIWIDPTTDTYVILLANAIHPRGNASISPLRGQLATAAAKALNTCPVSTICDNVIVTSESGIIDLDHGVPQVSLLRPGLSQCPEGATCPKLLVTSAASQFHSLVAIPQAPGRSTQPRVQTGIDTLEDTNFAALQGLAARHGDHLRMGLLTNQSGLDSHGSRTIDILKNVAPNLTLTTLFSPEHGLYGRQDTEHLTTESDPKTHLPVISLYGPKASDKHPKQSDLKQLDAIVIDLQDIGARFWTYEALLGYVLESAAKANIDVVVLDRPNPIAGGAPQGPLSDVGLESYTNFMPLPVRHSLTYGELARYFNRYATEVQLKPELLDAQALTIGAPVKDAQPPATQAGLHAHLTVVEMAGWHRSDYFADTGLAWLPPSPNMKTLAATILYPGVGLVEQTNVSVGRGTAAPFENLGAAFIDAKQLAAYLEGRHIAGITITATTLSVAEDSNRYPAHGQTIPAVHFDVTDRAAFDSPEFGVELLSALNHLYPQAFQLDRAHTLLASAATLKAIRNGEDPRDIASTWAPALHTFAQQTSSVLLYR